MPASAPCFQTACSTGFAPDSEVPYLYVAPVCCLLALVLPCLAWVTLGRAETGVSRSLVWRGKWIALGRPDSGNRMTHRSTRAPDLASPTLAAIKPHAAYRFMVECELSDSESLSLGLAEKDDPPPELRASIETRNVRGTDERESKAPDNMLDVVELATECTPVVGGEACFRGVGPMSASCGAL